jgi:PEP-CTERM motif
MHPRQRLSPGRSVVIDGANHVVTLALSTLEGDKMSISIGGSRRVRFLIALVFGIAAAFVPGRAKAQVEESSWWVPFPPSPCDNFLITYSGNQTANIPTQNASDQSSDPFVSPNPIQVSYNAGNNTTTVDYSGATAPPVNPNNVPPGNGAVAHFGLDNGVEGAGNLQPVSEEWLNMSTSYTFSLPVIEMIPTYIPPPSPTLVYMTIYDQYTSGGQTSGGWFEVPINPSGPLPGVTIVNPNSTPLTLGDLGYMITPTEIPLDQLNFGLEPPVGQPGSNFMPLPVPPPIPALGSVDIDVPEPGSVAVLAIGGLGLLRRRRMV